MKEHVGQVRRTGSGVRFERRAGIAGRKDSGVRWEGGEESIRARVWVGERVRQAPALR
jgi:hypothetical protein